MKDLKMNILYFPQVWLSFFVAAIMMSFLLYEMHKWSCKFCIPNEKVVKGLSSFFRCFWLIFGAMLNQGQLFQNSINQTLNNYIEAPKLLLVQFKYVADDFIFFWPQSSCDLNNRRKQFLRRQYSSCQNFKRCKNL